MFVASYVLVKPHSWFEHCPIDAPWIIPFFETSGWVSSNREKMMHHELFSCSFHLERSWKWKGVGNSQRICKTLEVAIRKIVRKPEKVAMSSKKGLTSNFNSASPKLIIIYPIFLCLEVLTWHVLLVHVIAGSAFVAKPKNKRDNEPLVRIVHELHMLTKSNLHISPTLRSVHWLGKKPHLSFSSQMSGKLAHIIKQLGQP